MFKTLSFLPFPICAQFSLDQGEREWQEVHRAGSRITADSRGWMLPCLYPLLLQTKPLPSLSLPLFLNLTLFFTDTKVSLYFIRACSTEGSVHRKEPSSTKTQEMLGEYGLYSSCKPVSVKDRPESSCECWVFLILILAASSQWYFVWTLRVKKSNAPVFSYGLIINTTHFSSYSHMGKNL